MLAVFLALKLKATRIVNERRVMIDGSHKRYLGVDFAVWRNEGAWFWRLISPSGEVRTIGVSGKEAQALQEACRSIEEKLAFV